MELVAAPWRHSFAPERWPENELWTYDGALPGPTIRAVQGSRLRVIVENRLAEETTVHWHGIRVPNAMDGVPHLTQAPIPPGGRFVYEFDLPDAGTYWYHPHQRSFEQVGRGLYGALIVEAAESPVVDRDVVWVLSDWRLLPTGELSDDFGNFFDVMHAGRVGNTVTVNGALPTDFPVRTGERIRLRLINAANARIFALEFSGHRPAVIATDGHPVEPHEPVGGRMILGPAMRVDLILDATGDPAARHAVRDSFYKDLAYDLLHLAYEAKPAAGGRAGDAIPRLAPNTMPEPDEAMAERRVMTFEGGMMGGMMGAMMDGAQADMNQMMKQGMAWAVNGVANTGHVMEPALVLERGRSYVLELRNQTAWYHPIHLHGHAFRVVRRNGRPEPFRPWQDTVLIPPRETADIAFVADNPGDWMIHCHILEHQAGGMMAVLRVT
ncbi:MAG: multicopper oxidase family protein [Alphaproteobacteria bacterium]